MNASRFILIGCGALAVASVLALPDRAPAAGTTATPALIARGQYLTHGAGQCEDCHGPGLVGGPAPKGPPGVPWATNAPSLVGMTMFATDADAVTFLTTTKLPDGSNARPPMPRYMFNTDDATAIVAYLRSLK